MSWRTSWKPSTATSWTDAVTSTWLLDSLTRKNPSIVSANHTNRYWKRWNSTIKWSSHSSSRTPRTSSNTIFAQMPKHGSCKVLCTTSAHIKKYFLTTYEQLKTLVKSQKSWISVWETETRSSSLNNTHTTDLFFLFSFYFKFPKLTPPTHPINKLL